MDTTKNDLSANHAKLDLQALIATAELAYARTRDDLNASMHELDNRFYDSRDCSKPTHMNLTAAHIASFARGLVTICETIETLHGCRTRELIDIVNREAN